MDDLKGLVRFVIVKLAKSGALANHDLNDEDIEQEGLLGAVSALRRFDPSKELEMSTFLVPRIRGAILDYVNKERNRGMASRRWKVDVVSVDDTVAEPLGEEVSEEDSGNAVCAFTYEDGMFAATPQSFENPEIIASAQQYAALVARLPKDERLAVERHFGLNGKTPMSFAEIQRKYRIPPGTSVRRLQQGLSHLWDFFPSVR